MAALDGHCKQVEIGYKTLILLCFSASQESHVVQVQQRRQMADIFRPQIAA
jgi:hypothetical protein